MLNTMFTTDIRQTLDHFRRSVDQLFDSFYAVPASQPAGGSNFTEGSAQWTFSPALESGWTDNALHLRAIVPGVAEKDLKVTVQNNQLVIEGERKAPEGFGKNWFNHLSYGKFYTAVTLPNGLDLDRVVCRLHDGVLDIEAPLAEAMRPRQIPIQNGERKAISA
ncbi:MAG: Hsp20/alpha crystallin family protein [Bryobacteraceae bacterium]